MNNPFIKFVNHVALLLNSMNCLRWICSRSILHSMNIHRMLFDEKSIQWNVSPTLTLNEATLAKKLHCVWKVRTSCRLNLMESLRKWERWKYSKISFEKFYRTSPWGMMTNISIQPTSRNCNQRHLELNLVNAPPEPKYFATFEKNVKRLS